MGVSAQTERKTVSSSAILFCPGLRQTGWCPPTLKRVICSALPIDSNGDLLQKYHQRHIQIILVSLVSLWVFFIPVKLTIKWTIILRAWKHQREPQLRAMEPQSGYIHWLGPSLICTSLQRFITEIIVETIPPRVYHLIFFYNFSTSHLVYTFHLVGFSVF